MSLPRNFDVAVGAVMVADVGGVMDVDEVVVVVFEPKSLIGVLAGGIVRFISLINIVSSYLARSDPQNSVAPRFFSLQNRYHKFALQFLLLFTFIRHCKQFAYELCTLFLS